MSICSVISPSTYELLLRFLPSLAGTEIIFALIGADRFEKGALGVADYNRRIHAFDLPKRFANVAKMYARWLIHTAETMVKQSDIVGNVTQSVLDARLRRTERNDGRGRYDYGRDRASDAEDYGWKRTLVLILVTSLLALLVFHYVEYFFPHLSPWWEQRWEARTKGQPGYAKVLIYILFRVPATTTAYALVFIGLAGAVYVVGLLLQACSRGVLWALGGALNGVARGLSHKKLRTAALIVALVGIDVPPFLPPKLSCAAPSRREGDARLLFQRMRWMRYTNL